MLLTSTLKYATALALTSTALTALAQPSADSSSGHISKRATTCNGHAEFCNRSFGNITFIGSHDSYAIGVNNLAVNQDQTVMQQLNDGIRMLQSQAHNANGVIRLCHSNCGLLDGGSLEDYLKIVKQWLDANPNEVLSLLIVNIDNLPPTAYDTVFKAVGLDTLSYAPTTQPLPPSGWPTLGSLIDSGKRLLTFLDNQANTQTLPYLLDEFSNIWETAYDVTDPNFDCAVNRTHGEPASQMYIINHFLDKITFGALVPALDKANQTNSASSIGAQVSGCVASHGLPPNFILVDFYEFGGGSVFQAAADLNGVKYSPATPVAKPKPTDATSTSASTISSTSGALPGKKSAALSVTHNLSMLLLGITSLAAGAFTVL